MKIIVENSTWNNLGDGFYQSTLFELYKKAFPNAKVYMGEGPVRRAFKPTKWRYENALKLIDHQDADLHVFSGPLLQTFIQEYGENVKMILSKGNNYALISCSCNGMKGNKLKTLQQFLKDYPPVSFSSRDPETYEKFKDFVPSAYNGICTAWLVDKLLPIDDIRLEKPYFISSFYKSPEPNFKIKNNDEKITIDNIEVNPSKHYLSSLLPWSVSRHLEYKRKLPKNIDDHLIVRTVQGLSTKSNYYNFKAPNSFISFNPITFLSVFKGTEFTISDRIHACAVTLAFGKPARILINTARSGIYDRMGLTDYKTNGGYLDPAGLDGKIDFEMEALINYIQSSLNNG